MAASPHYPVVTTDREIGTLSPAPHWPGKRYFGEVNRFVLNLKLEETTEEALETFLRSHRATRSPNAACGTQLEYTLIQEEVSLPLT